MKTLLVTSMPPSKESMSGSLLVRLAQSLPQSGLSIFFLGKKNQWGTINGDHVQTYSYPTNWDFGFSYRFFPRPISAIIRYFKWLKKKTIEVNMICRAVCEVLKTNEYDSVWIIVNHPIMIWIANRLYKITRVPIRVQLIDDPSVWIGRCGLDRFTSAKLSRELSFCLSSANSLAISSLPGNKSDSFLSVIGFGPAIDENSRIEIQSNSVFKIGVADNLIFSDSFAALIAALDSTYWELNGRKVEIHYWGSYKIIEKRTRIIVHEAVDEGAIASGLSSCDVAYFPVCFNRVSTELVDSFAPPVLVEYLASNCVMLYHGPKKSHLADFLCKGIAVGCFSNEHEALKMNLRKVMLIGDHSERVAQAKDSLLRIAGEERLLSNFRKFLGYC